MTRALLAIAAREAGSMLRVPAGWVVIALYLLLAGIIFTGSVLVPGEVASLAPLFRVSGWLLLPVIPAIAMRLFAEEFRSGTIEPLMTAPVGDVTLVLGKFLGACLFLLLMLAPTLLHVAILHHFADPKPDAGAVVAGYLSLLLQALLFLAIGTLASSLTSNQTLAFLLGMFGILGALVVSARGVEWASTVPNARLRELLLPLARALAVEDRVKDFARGVIDSAHVVFFLSASAVFLALTVVSVQSRRWR